jgi:hypothetical protein
MERFEQQEVRGAEVLSSGMYNIHEQRRDDATKKFAADRNATKVKLQRAHGGCLGARSR